MTSPKLVCSFCRKEPEHYFNECKRTYVTCRNCNRTALFEEAFKLANIQCTKDTIKKSLPGVDVDLKFSSNTHKDISTGNLDFVIDVG